MNIVWRGQSYFQISSQKNKNSSIELAVEPFGKNEKNSFIKADIVIKKEGEKIESKEDSFFILSPGEYEIGGVFIHRVSYLPNKYFSLIEAEGIRICHLSEYAQDEISPEYLEIIDGVDVLMIPIGGGEKIGPKKAVKIISQIEPKIVIPMEYTTPSKEKEEFLKIMGVKLDEEVPKLNIKEKDLPLKEGVEVVVLSAIK